jgi:hypothetical protein
MGTRLFAVPKLRRVLDTQLAAPGLPGAEFKLGLMLPYLSRAEELDRWAAYVRRRLSGPLRLGAIDESPAGALELAEWLGLADFAAIGCNDLTQCLFAADRDLSSLPGYLDSGSPVRYRFLRRVALTAGARVGEVQSCGLLAQIPGVLPILLGLGFRTFSVDAGLIPWLSQRVRGIRTADSEALSAAVCAAHRSFQEGAGRGVDRSLSEGRCGLAAVLSVPSGADSRARAAEGRRRPDAFFTPSGMATWVQGLLVAIHDPFLTGIVFALRNDTFLVSSFQVLQFLAHRSGGAHCFDLGAAAAAAGKAEQEADAEGDHG